MDRSYKNNLICYFFALLEGVNIETANSNKKMLFTLYQQEITLNINTEHHDLHNQN